MTSLSPPRVCAQCRRPAAARARHCLYCGAPLPGAGDGLSTSVAELPPVPSPFLAEADDGEADWLVMVTPPGGDPARWVASVARALGADDFIVRQRLLRGKPFVGAAGLEARAAAALQGALAALGIASSCFTARDVASLPDPIPAAGGALAQDAAVLEIRGLEEARLPYEAVFLVVQGEITERRRDVTTRDAPSSQIHGLHPTARHRTVEHEVSVLGRLAVDVYHTLSLQPYRLAEPAFRYAAAATPVARQALTAFVTDLRARAPHEVFDASFGERDAVNVLPRGQRQVSHLHARTTSTTLDNQHEFDSYSASLFLHVLKLRRGARAAGEGP